MYYTHITNKEKAAAEATAKAEKEAHTHITYVCMFES
jgi:hypothetical protein